MNIKKLKFLKDDILSNKNIFLDQQKLAIAHIQKHLPNILKNYKKKTSTMFPGVNIITEKIKQYGTGEDESSKSKTTPPTSPFSEEGVDDAKSKFIIPMILQITYRPND